MALDLLRLLLGGALLAYASASDWRKREVGDWVWSLMGGAGFLLFALEVYGGGGDPRTYLILLPPGLLLLDALWDRPEGRWASGTTLLMYATAAGTAVYLMATFPGFGPGDQATLRRGFGILVIVLLAYLFYYLGLLKGGADAKGFMCIGILVPGYPSLGPLPLVPLQPSLVEAFELLFPFALSTLMNSAILLLGLPFYFLLRNTIRGDFRWPQALLGYKAPLDRLPRFVWVLQEAGDEGVRYHVLPRLEPGEANLERLRELGIERVWVTPQLPFLIPMTVGFFLTFIVGNLLFGVLSVLKAL